MRLFCYIGLHNWKTTEKTYTVFVIKEYCKCKFCKKEKVFVSENDCY